MSDTTGAPGSGAETQKDGIGPEGTIPAGSSGVGVGSGEPTTFEPEEDPEAASAEPEQPDAGLGHA